MNIICQLIGGIGVEGVSFLGFNRFPAGRRVPRGAFDVLDPPEGLVLVVAVELHGHDLADALSSLSLLDAFPVPHLAVDPHTGRAVLINAAFLAFAGFSFEIHS